MSNEIFTQKLFSQMSLEEIQKYMHQMTQSRGFDQESPQATLLVMIEEFGELAKAIRKHIGIKIDHTRLDSYGNLKHELADVLICLVILANKCHIDLFEAFQEKEMINATRTWKVAASEVK